MQYDDIEPYPNHDPARQTGESNALSSLLPTVLKRTGLDHDQLSQSMQVHELVAGLEHPAWYIRASAARQLGLLGKRAPLEPLVAALDDEHESVRVAVLHALSLLGKRTPVEKLAAALRDRVWYVREVAALTLGELGKQAPLEPLLATALRDEDASVREAARLALEQTHPEALLVQLPAPIISSDDEHSDPDFSLPGQAPSRSEMEMHTMLQAELDGQLHQLEEQKASRNTKVPMPLPREGLTGFSLRKRKQGPPTPRRSRFLHLVNGIAAVLVVGLLIVGALLLFSHRPSAPALGGSAGTNATPTNAAFPDCGSGFLKVYQICQDHLYKEINLAGSIGGYTLMLGRAYADTNWIIFEYTVTRNADHQQFPAHIAAWTLRTQYGRGLWGGGGESAYDPKTKVAVQDDMYDASTVPDGTKELTLHFIVNMIQINRVDVISGGSSPVTTQEGPSFFVHGQVVFNFTLPVIPGREANLHQVAVVGGTSVTLERAVVTRTATRLYVEGEKVTPGDTFTLSAGDRNLDLLQSWAGGAIDQNGGMHPFYTSTSVVLDFDRAFNFHGEWTLRVSSGKNGGPWIFHFSVP
jgi:HEAT repeats